MPTPPGTFHVGFK
jgi:hypothetical protein